MDSSSPFFQGQPQPNYSGNTSNHQCTSNCPICNKPTRSHCASCVKCNKTFHRHCAGISNNQLPFTCVTCAEEVQAPVSPRSVHSVRSNGSNSSRNSIIRKRNLELQRLEEERQMAMERDRQFLEKKYKLLEQAEEELEIAQSLASNSVHDWVDSLPDPQVHNAQNVLSNQQDLLETTCFALPSNSHDHFRTPAVNHNPTQNTTATNTDHYSTLAQAASNSLPTYSVQNNIQNKTPHVSFNSTFQNNTGTLIGTTFAAPTATDTATPLTSSARLPQQEAFEQSFSPDPCSSINANLTYQQMNARQTVPKELPIFTGNPEEWPLFSSTYNWSTKVCGLTDAENLVRLQKALRGNALQSVQQILIHPSCVPTAISTLQLLFGQPEKILQSLKMKIRSLPTINPNKLDTITSFAVQVKGLQATIEACGLFDELNNSSLLQELVSKLPCYFQINWGTYKMNLSKNNKKTNLSEFADWIFDIGLSASSVNVESSLTANPEMLPRSKQRNAFVHTHTDHNNKNCIICAGNCNNITTCHKFTTLDRAERWNIVREYKLCKQCLRQHYGTCNSNNVCGVDGCQYKHHSLLHKSQTNEEVNQRGTPSLRDSNQNNNNQPESCNAHSVPMCHNLFKIIPITIYGNADKFVKTFAFIDEGSSTSLIDEQIVRDLNLTGTVEPLCLKWTGNIERNEESSRRLCITVSGPNEKKFKADVHTVKYLALPQQTMDTNALVKHYPYLRDLPIQSYEGVTPRVLIGLNNSRLCTSKRTKEGKIHEPVAICTRLGWLVYGSMKESPPIEHHHYHICDCNAEYEKKLYNLIKKFYCLETSGIKDKEVVMSKDDERAVSLLKKCTKQLADGHYETSLLWRDDNVVLPNNYDMAVKRLLCLEKKLKSDKNLQNVFHKTISEYLSKGYITKIFNQYSSSTQTVWYLPFFPILNRNKPGKVRIVWDAAAKSKGVSLNSMLLKGPDLLSSLPSILFRFRQKAVALCGDIEQMFHQVFIRSEDRNVQRFLWRTEETNKEPDVYIMNVMIFGASCAPCISQYVKNMNAEKFHEQYPLATSAIKQNHYVDDYLDSVDTVEEALTLATEVKYIHSKAGFNIRNWVCNHKEVSNALNEYENHQHKSLNLGSELDVDKILGVFWKSTDDSICFKLSPYILESETFIGTKTPTKRELLKMLMTIYDPLGLIGHYLMYLKIVLQEVWRSGVGWDEEIQPLQISKWSNWLSRLPEIQHLKIPRCYLQSFKNYNDLDVQLHTFADASENGYAAVSYFRISDGNDVVVSLVGSKTRVAPLRITSIPRLELMAALIAARFANSIVSSTTIQISQKIFWSDSRTVISWIRSDHRRYHQFVAFRVSEILDTTELSEWRWITGKFNVADDATKWTKNGPDLNNSSRWLNGPEFLKHPQIRWPCEEGVEAVTECELRQHLLLVQEVIQVIDVYRFSQWRRALRAMAYVIRFINKMKKNKISSESHLEQYELKLAEAILLKQAQEEQYLEERTVLQSGGIIHKNSSIYKLSPYLDADGVLRIDGRIDKSCVPDECKYPAIMPKYSYITKLIILHFHAQYLHANHETAINEIRQRYYVPRLRTVFKTVTRECQMCKIKKVTPICPQMAKLPRARLSAFVRPFTFTGLDFFGPIMVIVNRHKEKRYGALFTCLTIRAVHVEIVHSLNTSSCILAIRNFIARRGTPREIFSDNGTNFVGAERELREAVKEVDTNEFVREFTTACTKWSFNPPSAPPYGRGMGTNGTLNKNSVLQNNALKIAK